MHGQFEEETEEIKTETSWNWFTKGDLKREMESLLITAQDQALNTNLVKRGVYNMGGTNKRMLTMRGKSGVSLIVSAC